ncbi:MAG TPA: RagB/SusD family nutrient uptake outer membrane protein, partial [Bacteroidales bacterium]
MKKYIFILLSVFLILIALSSCKKSFLDETNFSAYTPATLGDSLGFEASAIGLYNRFSLFLTKSDAQGWLSVWQIGTDIAYGGAGNVQGIETPYFNYEKLTNQDAAASFTWQWAYQLIGDANSLISIAENPSLGGMTQRNKNRIDGEARFFRAYAYNVLATCFGGVPVITKPLTAPKTDFVRAPLDTVNKLIETDLLFAAKNLPDIENVYKDSGGKKLYGRAHKEMAFQLLAETYLRMNKPALAEAQCDSVINGGKFKLVTTRYGVNASKPGDPFSDMFIKGNQRRLSGNTESIWVLEQENPATIAGGQTGSPQQRRQWGAAYYQIAGMALADSLGGRGIC